MKNYIILLITIGLLSFSCQSDIEFEVESMPTKIVLKGVLESDSAFKVHVSRSLPPTGKTEASVIENANIVILSDEGGTFPLTLVDYNEYGNNYPSLKYYKSVEGFKPKKGIQYSIEVKAEGLPSVTASFKMPLMPQGSNVKFASESFIELESNSELHTDPGYFLPVRLTINDQPGENYYELTVYEEQKASEYIDVKGDTIREPAYFTPSQVFSYNPLLNSYNIHDWADADALADIHKDGTLLFSDSFFDGESLEVELLAKTSPRTTDMDGNLIMAISSNSFLRYHVQIRNVSKEYYTYKQTLIQYWNTRLNDFVEPVNIYSNVNGGLGIFAGETVQTFILEPSDPSLY
ncbi:DUF4249 domain-containing protein [Cytophagales bacterium LB-30]|uniref:DUF4249 domain-containing protein n=1 Tax=Shiella aurantiaca TaxID=3058365 RepID=A0ABT8F7A0_9BACT|nr:DUF4249 domain-containing protein [Shiella aurantiaca]MDN4166091.1 DUF4249 domain-containing protein [Shiella aurantiaca]